MENKDEFRKIYIGRYQILEEDFRATTRYVTLDEINNFDTYSNAFLNLLLSIGSEIDVLKDYLAALCEPNSKDSANIVIIKNYPNIKQIELIIEGTIEKNPIKPWNYPKEPDWWTVYNETKHNRTKTIKQCENDKNIELGRLNNSNQKPTPFTYSFINDNDKDKEWYQFANQRYVLYALGGLFILENLIYKKIQDSDKENIVPLYLDTIFSFKDTTQIWDGIEFAGKHLTVKDECLIINDLW